MVAALVLGHRSWAHQQAGPAPQPIGSPQIRWAGERADLHRCHGLLSQASSCFGQCFVARHILKAQQMVLYQAHVFVKLLPEGKSVAKYLIVAMWLGLLQMLARPEKWEEVTSLAHGESS